MHTPLIKEHAPLKLKYMDQNMYFHYGNDRDHRRKG